MKSVRRRNCAHLTLTTSTGFRRIKKRKHRKDAEPNFFEQLHRSLKEAIDRHEHEEDEPAETEKGDD